jgi:hypothetical protein
MPFHVFRRQQMDACRRQKISMRHPYMCLLLLLVYGVVFETTTFASTQHGSKQQHLPESITTSKQQTIQTVLRASNLEILPKATPIDIVFQKTVATTNNDNDDRTYRGGLNDLGQEGYRPDPMALRNNPPEFGLTSKALQDVCKIRDSDYSMIHEKVSIDASILSRTTTTTVSSSSEQQQQQHDKNPKILCVVQTSGHRHWDRIPALRRTWG